MTGLVSHVIGFFKGSKGIGSASPRVPYPCVDLTPDLESAGSTHCRSPDEIYPSRRHTYGGGDDILSAPPLDDVDAEAEAGLGPAPLTTRASFNNVLYKPSFDTNALNQLGSALFKGPADATAELREIGRGRANGKPPAPPKNAMPPPRGHFMPVKQGTGPTPPAGNPSPVVSKMMPGSWLAPQRPLMQVPEGTALPSGPPSIMRNGSFTAGTTGRLMRPGVGVGTGAMREARYEDLVFVMQIGEGGFGKVYYGHWQGEPVAIKVATPASPDKMQQQVLEFQREVTTMSTLPAHQNVLRLIAACMQPPHLALITECCHRGSLYNLLHAPGAEPLPGHQMLAIWLGVARGMQHLHQYNVLHRDLKSANLLLDDMGSVKIADFGLSRVHETSGAKQILTGGLGTPQWMAPEVMLHMSYSQKADVYSFGMVMWECITQQVPYKDMPVLAASHGVAYQGLRPDIPKHVDERIAALIRSCWAPVADQRPSFEQIVGVLQSMMDSLTRPMPPMPSSQLSAAAQPSSATESSSSQEFARSTSHKSTTSTEEGSPTPPSPAPVPAMTGGLAANPAKPPHTSPTSPLPPAQPLGQGAAAGIPVVHPPSPHGATAAGPAPMPVVHVQAISPGRAVPMMPPGNLGTPPTHQHHAYKHAPSPAGRAPLVPLLQLPTQFTAQGRSAVNAGAATNALMHVQDASPAVILPQTAALPGQVMV
mmetsp:Transcript_18618/g.39994  ORF Transcript_18618/g.39994 Transcript_18618/m.39994 type:complete len:707 (-) Transcript_18618:573-2693(-)|eukprot:CAMPEP_0202891688 /NCGR_PEP_ID=MMETSP1392-20130828/1686_1 /ASSEMBLY_ACC=CAM_ASM_000868 /TAXON_ID=225041 /ORGANISM="Chlamydomonas chlamydogama, Strain SAG 11-48b" /LENGTH=706 /DNA_ID=CAMNT_0049575513 /DNA_START=445 /DNA_END=2565 /DNA_ORIENTATION=+